MNASILVLGGLAWLLAGSMVLLGRNLTRSIVLGYAFVGTLCLTLVAAGADLLAGIVSILTIASLATLQVFGWMLVDVDRDHLTPTDAPTWIARALAFVVLGGGLGLLIWSVGPELASRRVGESPDLVAAGQLLFGRLGGLVLLLGLALGAALLATMTLLRDDGEGS